MNWSTRLYTIYSIFLFGVAFFVLFLLFRDVCLAVIGFVLIVVFTVLSEAYDRALDRRLEKNREFADKLLELLSSLEGEDENLESKMEEIRKIKEVRQNEIKNGFGRI